MSKNSSKDQFNYDNIADNLDMFVNDVATLFIFEGRSEKEVEESMKVLKKAIKHLRNGKPEKVLDMDKYEEAMSAYEN